MIAAESSPTPVANLPHARRHDHEHAHGEAIPHGPSRPPFTLLTSGVGHRLGAVGMLLALLWTVVWWALA